MSGDSNKGGDGDDLLSELLGLSDGESSKASSKNKLEEKSPSQDTEEEKNSLQAFLGVETSSGVDATEAQERPQHVDSSSDHTEAVKAPFSDDFFGVVDEPKESNNPFAEQPSGKTLVLGDEEASKEEDLNSSLGLEDETSLEPAMSFVSDASTDKPADSLDDQAAVDSDETSLDGSTLGDQDFSEEELDPIDRALREASSATGSRRTLKSSELEETPGEASAEDSALKVTDLFDSEASEEPSRTAVSEKDFADVFQSGPIQMPGSGFQKKKNKKIGLIVGAGLAASLAVVSTLSWAVIQLRSDEGLLGLRMNGFSFEAAYREPSAAQLQEFQLVFDNVRSVLKKDDPEAMKVLIPNLENVISQDVRNYEAISYLMEIYARLLAWEGVASPHAVSFDRLAAVAAEVAPKIQPSPDQEVSIRAQAWRSYALSDYSAAQRALESLAQSKPSLSDSSKALLAEVLWRMGDKTQAEQWASQLSEKDDFRIQYVKAGIGDNRNEMRALAKQSYLPARVMVELQDLVSVKSESALDPMSKLAEETKGYPWLHMQVLDHRADLYSSLGQSEVARKEWTQIIEKFSQQASVWLKLARSFREDNLWDESLEAYRSAVRVGGLQRPLAKEFVELLRLRMKVNEAFEVLEQAEKLYPKAEELKYEKGLVQLSVFQEEMARQSFHAALEINSSYEPAILSLAQIALNQEEYEEAEELFARIPDSSANQSRALAGRGQLARSQRQFDEAQKFFARAIRIDPKNEQAYVDLVEILLRSEEDKKAEVIVAQAKESMPNSPWTSYIKASLQRFRGEADNAIETLKDSMQSHSHLNRLHLLHVDALVDLKRFDKAEEILDRISKDESENPEYIYSRARFAFLDKRPTRSGSQLDLAWRTTGNLVQRYPDNESYLLLRAEIAKARGEKSNALELVEKIIRLYPDQAKAYLIRGDIHSEQGAFAQALESFESARQRTRFRGEIFRSLGRLYQARGEIEKAVSNYEQVVKWFPYDPDAHLELGRLYNDQGRYDQAVARLRKAIDLRPNQADPYFLLGFIYKEKGDSKRALEQFETFLRLNPSGVEAATIRDEVYFLRQTGVAN